MAVKDDDRLVAVSEAGRVYTREARPGLADCAPNGRMRLDAVARWLQDIAWADVDNAGVQDEAFWILRRTRIVVHRFPQISEPYLVRTFASGTGRMVAERRTVISPAAAPNDTFVDTVALWVHLRRESRLPSGLSPRESVVFEQGAAKERRVSHRLRHPRPEAEQIAAATETPWQFRRVDTDVADHVNNAAYWEMLEEEILEAQPGLAAIDAELEFRDGAQPGPARYLRLGNDRWLLDESGELVASFRLNSSLTG